MAVQDSPERQNVEPARESGGLEEATRGLLDVAQKVLAELDVDVVLGRVLEAARELTGARYAALGVLDESLTGLERFITAGLDDVVAKAIGAPPTGEGVLGELIRDPWPLRLTAVSEHASAHGFPAGHPSMRAFLGVPIWIGGRPFGNIYLTDKREGEPFTTRDEEALVVRAEFAGLAIDHARRYARSEARRGELQRTVDALDATVQISRALAGQTDLTKVLELVAKRGRALIDARTLVIELRERDDLVVGAVDGAAPDGLVGQRLKLKHTVASGTVLTLTTQRLEDERTRARFDEYGLGRLGVHAQGGLVVPLTLHGRAYGVLVALDRLDGGPTFAAHDQRLLEWFAASAATAVVTALVSSAQRERERIAVAEQERGRWARELHEGTLQRLAGVQLLLATADRTGELVALKTACAMASAELQAEISTLRSLSFELRPAVLDELGIESAIGALADLAEQHGISVELRVDLASQRGRKPARYTVELDTAIYRVIHEALDNVHDHAAATHATVSVTETDGTIELSIHDNGGGFDPAGVNEGYGLAGLRDRIELLQGELLIDTAPGHGTTLRASLPVRHRETPDPA